MKVISLPYIFQILYVLCFTRPRYHVSVYRTIGPLVVDMEFNYIALPLIKFEIGISKKERNIDSNNYSTQIRKITV